MPVEPTDEPTVVVVMSPGPQGKPGPAGGGGGSTDWDDITDKPSTFPPAEHTHTIDEVTGLQEDLDGKVDATSIPRMVHVNDGSGDPAQTVLWSLTPDPFTVPLRDMEGQVAVADPVAGTDAANKQYVDSAEAAQSIAPTGYDVILLAGQSNMVGYSGQAASATLDPAVAGIFQLKQDGTIVQATEFLDHPSVPTGVGPGFPFARNYVKAGLNRGRKVLLVPCAVVATHLVSTSTPTWNSTVSGSLLDAAIARANTAIAAEAGSRLVSILWIQGGADASESQTQAAYAAALDAVIAKLRSQITGASTTPFILSAEPPEADGTGTMVQIRAALADTPNRNPQSAYVAGPSNMSIAALHYSNAGERIVGARMFSAYQYVLTGIYVDDSTVPGLNPLAPAGMHVSGRYFVINSVLSSNAAATLNEMRLYAWPLFQPLNLAALYVQVAAAGSADSVVRLGVYADDGTGVPGALVMELGTVSTATIGVKELAVTSAITLPPGTYWVAAVAQGTTAPTMVCVAQNQPAFRIPIMFGIPAFNDTVTGYRQNGVSGALPATFVNSGAVINPIRAGYKVA